MKNKVEIKNISFKYGLKEVLHNINFEGSNGIIALLGKNGAGKTTLMNLITGMKNIKNGEILINNVKVEEFQEDLPKIMGYLPQHFEIYGNITGYNFLSYVYDIKGLEKGNKKEYLEEIIEKFSLKDVINKRFSSYSGGYKRRLGIAQAMIGDPKIVIVDEPTVGLDPEQRFEFRNYLSEIGEDRIVIISTHITEDIEFYCNKVLIMKNGALVFDGSREELLKNAEGRIFEGIISREVFERDKSKLLLLEKSNIDRENIKIRVILEKNQIYKELKEGVPTLEDAYIYYGK